MRVLMVTERFYPSQNGMVRRLVEGVRYISRAGHEIAVMAPDAGIDNFEGVPVFTMPSLRAPFLSQDPLPVSRRQVGAIMDGFRPDVVHLANPLFLGHRALEAALGQNRPVLASYHVPLEKQHIHPKADRPILRHIYWRYLRSTYNKTDLNLCTSRVMRHELEKRGMERLFVLRSGVDTAAFHPHFADEALRRSWCAGEEEIVLLYVGSLTWEKGLVRMHEMLERMPDVRLVLVGDGPAKPSLRRQFAGANVVFTGHLDEDALRRAYASADALVFPSGAEMPGSVILEAMASGLPVIAPAKPAFREQVQDGKTGLLYPTGDRDAFLDAVIELRDPGRRKSLSVAACHDAKRYSWTMTSQQLLDYYHLTIARHQRRMVAKSQGQRS